MSDSRESERGSSGKPRGPEKSSSGGPYRGQGRPSSGKPRPDSSRRYDDRPQKSPYKTSSSSPSKGNSSGFDTKKGVSKSQSDSGYNERGGNSKRGGDSSSGGGARGDKWSQKGEKDSTKPLGKAPPPADKSGKKIGKEDRPSDEKGDKREDKKHSKEVKSAAELEEQWQSEDEKKRKAEEEAKRIEEEKIRKEEEEQRRKEEEQKRLLEEEIKTVKDYQQECQERYDTRRKLRERNQEAAENRPDESFFSRLDSSLKKNTAFVKKLKNLTESQKESLTKDFNGLNLNKYIGEAAAAITEAKLKMSDIACGVHICCLFFQRYSDFSNSLMENWQKYLLSKKDEKITNPSKYRVDLRFFAELLSVGLFNLGKGLNVLAGQLSFLTLGDKEEHNNLTILTSFCKHCGDDYAGLLPRKIRLLAEKHGVVIPRSTLLPPERQKGCRNLLGEYYQSLCKHLLMDHKELKNMERQNRRILQTKGELSAERKETFDTLLQTYQKLLANTAVFADLLDEDLPELPEDEIKRDDDTGFDIFNPETSAEFQYTGDSTLFEDEDARSFYETLPDLKAFIPGICYKDSEQSGTKDGSKDDITSLDEDMESLQIEDVEREMETEKQIAEVESKEAEQQEQEEVLEDYGMLPDADEEDTDTGSLMKMQYEAYIQTLPNSVNKDLIDKAAVEFCMNFNTKSNRKKLVRALFTVHRTRYDLLPFYSRFVATLYPCMPDVASDLVQLLKGDFRWHVRKKDQINIESKLKTVRFIGELVKFKLFPKSEALHCLKMLMFDFSHHNIEMACALLDSCGRFLYRSQDSHHRTKIYLDVMMRKKSALHLESRYTTMIENAFYYSNPPETQQSAQKIRPPMHEYIRKLLYKDLSKVTTEKVLRQMRRLPWDDPEIAFYATKCLIAVWNVRYNSIHCAANLLAGLAPYHEHIAIQVVDGVLEDIRLGMEVNHPKYNQRRVSGVKYLGELYNYRMLESAVVFKTLYSFITFGVVMDDSGVSPLDPPEHLFRIRLVCVLLETCGTYFDKGSSKKKLDCFLAYFQRYYWFKRSNPIYTEARPFPVDVENLMIDTMECIRPKMRLHPNYEEACKAVEELENEYKQKVASVLTIIETDQEGSASETEEGLGTIQEAEEYGEDLSLSGLDESETSQEETSQSQRSTEDQGEEGGESCNEEDDEDVMESAGENEEDDQLTIMKGGPKHIKCSEDEDFMTAFDKMMTENIQARTNESLKVPQLDIAVPMNLKDKSKKTVSVNLYPMKEEEVPKEEDRSIEFVLMTRRGNRQHFTNLNVPISEEFATKYREREQAEKAEKEKMKQVVLGIHERQEEEDYQEMIASLNRVMPVNTNRERRVRYQHPKGAPDADLIFGSKKR
ncbi:regulator of nonsense transcripts 2-like isoform X1 [Crassostrea angulata]|uniref:regulator of nonsense transcripts 2-like isoform X1 n=2 Tax=Magallana angulata TaxID=2784310 RepID=UPI0022B14060|nr:regulator of nonsense transcripts 2-like isoform X1 [Crassostrea angulata]XP_052676377.1 regulator of nonsense transcripts 2-like isoform X1 [Crassostrea angulata]